jgi:hypothetical protein
MKTLDPRKIPKDTRLISRVLLEPHDKDLVKYLIVTRTRMRTPIPRITVNKWTKLVIVRNLDDPNVTLVWSTQRTLGMWTAWTLTLNQTNRRTLHLTERQMKNIKKAGSLLQSTLEQTRD